MKLLAFAAIALVGCGTPGGDSNEAETREVTTDLAGLGNVDLTVWVVAEGQQQAEILADQFEQEHPNISVDLVVKGYHEIANTEELVLSSDDAPDVMTLSGQAMRPAVKGNLLRPLGDYASAYGWTDQFGSGVLDSWRLTSDGTTVGEGELYAISQFGELVGMYYNRAKLRPLGLGVPATLDEFERAMEAAAAQGDVALQFGNLDGQLGNHLYGSLLNADVSDASEINDAVFGTGDDIAFPTGAATTAAQRMVEWADRGFFPADYAGVKELAAVERFSNGEGVFLIDGTWANTQLATALGDDLGFFALPRADGATPIVTGGGSAPFAIPARSDQPDAAAGFIDHAVGEPNIEASLETNQLPSFPVPPSLEPTGSVGDVLATWREVNEDDTLAQYLGYATPAFWDTELAAIQELLARRLSPEALVDELVAHIDEYRASAR